MTQLNLTELAKQLSVSKGRVSQYVKAGKLDGCFDGEGRQRRFDVQKCATALGKRLDPGQMMGNGSGTQKAITTITEDGTLVPSEHPAGAAKLPSEDDDAYKMARTQIAMEDARTKRRNNAVGEGTYVLASEVAHQTRKQIAQEVAEFESVLRDGARRIADELGVDFKEARAILIDMWRSHRERRTKMLEVAAGKAEATEEEKEADI
jgi:hypothetical protein